MGYFMKKIKKTSVALLSAFILTACSTPHKIPKYPKYPDPRVVKLADTITELKKIKDEENNPFFDIGYKLDNGHKIEFNYIFADNKYSLYVQILKEGHPIRKGDVAIIDYNLNNLDSRDRISYVNSLDRVAAHTEISESAVRFRELSYETQEEFKKQYDSIIEEAPEKLWEAYADYKQEKIKKAELKKKEFEEELLDVFKK